MSDLREVLREYANDQPNGMPNGWYAPGAVAALSKVLDACDRFDQYAKQARDDGDERRRVAYAQADYDVRQAILAGLAVKDFDDPAVPSE